MNTSAPRMASPSVPAMSSGLVFSAIHCLTRIAVRGAAAADGPLAVAEHDLPAAHRHQQLGDGRAGRARPGNGDAHVGQLLLHDLQGVLQRRQDHDGRAVLIVVEHGNIQLRRSAAARSRRSAARRCLPG